METETRIDLFAVASVVILASVLGGVVGFQYAENRFQNLENRIESQQRDVVYFNTSSPEGPAVGGPVQRNSTSLTSIFRDTEQSVVSVRATGSSQGSGFVFRPDGYIVTNQHVVEGSSEAEVELTDGSTLEAEVVGTDPYTDLAVLKVDRSGLEPLRLADSSRVEPGQTAVAIGNPFGFRGSMTAGIVSQTERLLPVEGDFSIPNVVQTDAAINPGNSGGPLLNSEGQVIGVNTAIETRTGTFSGVGFAIPSNTVRRVAPEIIRTGDFEHPWIGVSGLDLDPEISRRMELNTTSGFLVVDVVSGGPAEGNLRAGDRVEVLDGRRTRLGGDVIVAIEGERVRGITDILTYLDSETEVGESITLTVIRGGERRQVELTLQRRPQT